MYKKRKYLQDIIHDVFNKSKHASIDLDSKHDFRRTRKEGRGGVCEGGISSFEEKMLALIESKWQDIVSKKKRKGVIANKNRKQTAGGYTKGKELLVKALLLRFLVKNLCGPLKSPCPGQVSSLELDPR